MTSLDALVAELRKQGWIVWHLGNLSSGAWQALLYTDHEHPAVQDSESRRKGGFSGGFSRTGLGPTMELAIKDAARDILSPPKHDAGVFDLDAMLGLG